MEEEKGGRRERRKEGLRERERDGGRDARLKTGYNTQKRPREATMIASSHISSEK